MNRRGRKLDKLDAEAAHKLRLDAKQLRYATGFFADLYTGNSAKAHKRVRPGDAEPAGRPWVS